MTRRALLFLLLFWLLFTNTLQEEVPSPPHVCVWHENDVFYDLSPLTVDVGSGYTATSKDGGMPYFFNFCAPTALGGCQPNTAVCQVGASTYMCGGIDDVSFEKFDDGIKITYKGGDACSSKDRSTTINVHCDKNATSLRVGNAREKEMCTYEIDVYSFYGCPHSISSIPSLPVNIYLVVHSHDDVGWLKTYDDYYGQQVKNIIENVITSINRTESRKFIQVEQAYFARWWDIAKDDPLWYTTVHKLINNKQLSFTIGGWVMPDEATPSYGALITQLTEGHQYLKRHFNYTPDVGWQIDPFGASSVMAEIYSETGFKGHVIDRINFMEKTTLQSQKALQFYWKFSKKDKKILTHILDSNYCYPFKSGLRAPYRKSDTEVIEYAKLIVDYARLKARSLLTPNVMIPVGCDFAYDKADETEYQYEALDRAMDYIRKNSAELNVGLVQYSDVSDYFTALHSSSAEFPTPANKVDFFPYNDANNSWWTGYYTTAPKLKGLIRQSEAVLRSSELLFATTLMSGQKYDEHTKLKIEELTRAISVNLHHDAITGTANFFVVDNYHLLLNNALPKNLDIISSTLSLLSTDWKDDSTLVFNSSPDLSQVIPVVVYNSLPWIRHDYVKITLQNFDPTNDYSVSCDTTTVKSEVVVTTEEAMLFFRVELPPIGFKTFFISSSKRKSGTKRSEEKEEGEGGGGESANETPPTIFINNKKLTVSFSAANSIDSITFNSKSIPFHQFFMLYESYDLGDPSSSEHNQESGPYIFRPNGEPYLINNSTFASASRTIGSFIANVYQTFDCSDSATSFVKQHVRVFQDDDEFLGNFVELSQTVGPLPLKGVGRELITRFVSPVATNTSYTDSNGLRFIKREYDSSVFLPIPGNYYPTVYASYIQHENDAVGFVFDRAHGFSNGMGKTEVMLHRRITSDDNKGVGKRQNDDTVIDPVIRLVFGSPKEILRRIYKHIYLLNFPPVVAIKKPIENSAKYQGVTSFSLLAKELPENVHLVDLKSANSSNPLEFIMRLTHLFDINEHETLSQDAEIFIHDFFKEPFCISKLSETQLTATTVQQHINLHGINASIILKPKQIRTFLVEITREQEDLCEKHNPCENGKCIKLPCSYICECLPSFIFDEISQKCISDPLASEISAIHQFPLAVIAYLSFICGYSIRSELRKMHKIGEGKKRKKEFSAEEKKRGGGGKIRTFLQVNKRMLEHAVFPSSLSRHHD